MTHHYCVVGNPIAHSKSPLIHGLFAAHCGIDLEYGRAELPLDGFREAFTRLLQEQYRGCNVTAPFKGEVVPLCRQISDRARLAQAVNTVIRLPDGSLRGDNTDGVGLVTDLSRNLQHRLQDKRILIAGAGGAARGILPSLLESRPAQVVISNRTHARAEQLAAALSAYGPLAARPYTELDSRFDLIINATSASFGSDVPPVPGHCIDGDTVCYDLVYSDEPTAFLRWCESRGAGALHDGLGMLVEQAAESFYLWEGVRPDNSAAIIQQLRNTAP
ncbi:shikimate dehydrogenase [Granulosicoccaceae sp. 1_MG-2023]|nr:shikimate dehydrogenase [Granulosicoccaceae sp. 1_MG-2023]